MNTVQVDANGLTFECWYEGTGDRLALCLHGFPDNARSMAPLLDRLADAGFTAVAPALRGYAPTEPAPDGEYSARALGADAIALAETLPESLGADLDTEDPVLVGHDWGAVAGYAAARADPGAFDRMVTMAVPPRFPPAPSTGAPVVVRLALPTPGCRGARPPTERLCPRRVSLANVESVLGLSNPENFIRERYLSSGPYRRTRPRVLPSDGQ